MAIEKTAPQFQSNNKAVFLLCAGIFLLGSSLYIYTPILSPYSKIVGASLSLIGLISGSYGFVQLFTKIPMGLLSDQGGSRSILIAGPICAGLGCLGFGLFNDPKTFVAWRALAGLGGAAFVVFPPVFLTVIGTDETGVATNVMVFLVYLSQTASSLVGGELAQRFGWRTPFLVGAALAAISAGMLGLVDTRPQIQAQAPRKTGFTPSTGSRQRGEAFVTVLKNRTVLSVVLLVSVATFAHWATLFSFVPIRAAELGASRGKLGVLTATTTSAVMVANLTCATWLTARLKQRWIVALGMGLLGMGTVVLPWIEKWWPLLASQAVAGLGWGLVLPALMATALEAVGPSQHGAASGISQWGNAVGILGGSAVGGLIGQYFGLDAIFLIAGLPCLLAVAYLLQKEM